jgi:hypothetical protein
VVSDIPREQYSSERQELRRRWRFFWFVFLAYLPLGGFFMVLNAFDPLYFALPWMGLFVIAGARLGFFRCPSCEKLAFQTSFWHNPFSRRCLHCGLQLR